ncbi:hypothetical protein MHBO_001764 [Bonamia ostreae]|uniref:Uncharacterized protein n=1 Tax=Bonamia ostreae TaxID=126728 RepID=A0ABV2AK79_9EUKA
MANYFDRSIFLNEQSLLPIYEQVLKTPENLQKNIYFLEKAVETKNEKIVEHIIDKISDRFLIPAQKWLKIAQTFDENEKMFLKICEMGLKQFPTETLWIAYLLKLIKLKKLKKIDFELLSRKFDCAIDQIGFYSSKLLDVSKNLENEIKAKNFSEKRKSENWNNLNFENKFKTLTENSKKGKLDESETYFHFNSYVEAIKLNFKNDKNLTKFIKSIFERFIEHFYFFGIFWKEYLNFAEKFDDIKNIINVYERALKSNPDKFDFYENYFLFLEKNKMQNKIEEVALNAEKRKLCGENNIFIRFFPIVSKIRQLRLRKQNLTEQNLDKIREEMDKFYKTALKNKETKNCFEIFHFFGFVELKYFSDSAKAKFWINRNLEIFNNSVKAFTVFYSFL